MANMVRIDGDALWQAIRRKDEYHIKMLIFQNMLEDMGIDVAHIVAMTKDEAGRHLINMHRRDVEVFE